MDHEDRRPTSRGLRYGPSSDHVIDSHRQNGRDLAEEVYDLLLDSPHFVPGMGLIDHVRSEGSPVEVPFKDQLKNYLFTIAVESRES